MIKKIKSFFTLPFYPNPCPPRIQPQIFHSRTGQEVDIVLEDPKGWRVGIEIKTAAVVGSEDFKGLRDLGEAGASIFTEELSYTQALEWFLYIPPLE